jgi:hypothetical protein
MAEQPPNPRSQPRRGSVERPVSGRLYRLSWAAVAAALAIAAFSVGRSDPLPQPELPPSFDAGTALQLTSDLATRFPDRTPGTKGAGDAARWVAEQFAGIGLTPQAQVFRSYVPELGSKAFANVFAVVPGDSRQVIVVMAHRDNLGVSPGADDNASGTAALIELARNAVVPDDSQRPVAAHTIVLLSTDGGAYGSVGAAQFAQAPEAVLRFVGPDASVVAVVNLDAIAGAGSPALELAGDVPRAAAPALVATAQASLAANAGAAARMPSFLAQGFNLAFPVSFRDQGALVAEGISAVTLTTSGATPRSPQGDAVGNLDPGRLSAMGRSAQALLTSLDQAAEVARGTEAYLYVGSRIVHGWAIQLVLLALLVPFLAATVDLLARVRARGIALAPAFRSLRSRLGVWAWAGGLFALFSVAGIFPNGPDRPVPLYTPAATDWPVTALVVLAGLLLVGWLVARPRLAPTRRLEPTEELAGHVAAMLVLGIVALAVAVANPFSLVFVLPSLHAWLWIPQTTGRAAVRVGLFLVGLAGPLVLVWAFVFGYDLGVDGIWYILALVSVGYVPLALALAFLVWGAVAEQVGAIAVGRYAPYPEPAERDLGPIRQSIRQGVLARRRRVYTRSR